MADPSLPATQPTFEELKRRNDHGAEYWSARDLQPLLGYSQWRRFEDAIDRARTSCEQSGNKAGHHFAGAGKMVVLGSGSQRAVDDYQLSRFACYLIAQNGDPRKPAIAQAQKYFAVQTRRQELSDEYAADAVIPGPTWGPPPSRLRAFAPSRLRHTPHSVTPGLTRGPPPFAASRLRVKPRRGEANPRRQIGRQSRSPAASSLPAAPRRAEIIFLQHAIRGIIRAQTMAGRAVHSARRRACKDFRKNRRFPPLRGQKHA